MKLSILIALCSTLFFVTACAQYGNEEYYNTSENYNQEYQNSNYQNNTYQNDAYQNRTSRQEDMTPRLKSGLKWHPTVNPKTGQTTSYVPLPTTWKVNANNWTGPNNTVVSQFNGTSSTLQQRNIVTVDQLVQQDFLPILQQQGVKINKAYDLKQVAMRDMFLYSQYWKVAPTNDLHQAKALEVENNKGEKGLIIVHFTLSRSQYGSFSFYYFHTMETKASYFEQAKKDFIYALSNLKQDDRYLAMHNQKEQMKSQNSWATHNRKMAQNQANFNRYQQTQKTNSDVSDIYHQTWKNTNDMNNAGHSKSVDGIYNQNTMTNPHTGQDVQVQYGYNNYYMNNNNQYIGTNDEFYNPQMDQNVNHQDWRKVEVDENDYDY